MHIILRVKMKRGDNLTMDETIFLVTWFGTGLLAMFIGWVYDMRGQPFDENYFDATTIIMSLFVLILGYIGLLISVSIICYDHGFLTKIIYKIANIGIKKKK